MTDRIYYTLPSITDLEVRYAADAAKYGWGENCYGYIEKFQELFRTHLGVKHAIATSSCTGALHIGLSALGIGVGDEVIMADTNWIATAAPIVHLGATPVFVDILADTWCIDPSRVEAAITSKTKAIVAVHLYGNLCDMDALISIGDRHGIPVVEDAAEAIGSSWKGKLAGSMGRFGAFSFHGSKTLTTGEGGMLVTNDDKLYERALTLSNHGRTSWQTKQFWPEAVGFKYKMSNIQAAIGCAQVERLDELTARKREILSAYRVGLSCYPWITLNPEQPETVNGAWMPTAVFSSSSNITREILQAEFASAHIDARVFFHPLSSLPMFSEKNDNRVAYDIPRRAINLPSYHELTSNQIGRVLDVIDSIACRCSTQ